MTESRRQRAVEEALAGLEIETPSWGYGDAGTRFAVFSQPGRPRDVFERLRDAAEVHRLTGAAPGVALHFPWDRLEDLSALRNHADSLGLRIDAVNPDLFEDPDYKLGSITHPDGELQGQVALVRGAAGGIGRAIADALSAAGAGSVGFYLDAEGAATAVTELRDDGTSFGGDVTADDAVRAAYAHAVMTFGGVDIVVSDAGDRLERSHRGDAPGRSRVFFASKNALVAGKNAGAYSSPKALELHLARCLAEEGGAIAFRVNTVNRAAGLAHLGLELARGARSRLRPSTPECPRRTRGQGRAVRRLCSPPALSRVVC